MNEDKYNIWQIFKTFSINYTTALSLNAYLQTKDEYMTLNYEKKSIYDYIVTYPNLMDDIYDFIEK